MRLRHLAAAAVPLAIAAGLTPGASATQTYEPEKTRQVTGR